MNLKSSYFLDLHRHFSMCVWEILQLWRCESVFEHEERNVRLLLCLAAGNSSVLPSLKALSAFVSTHLDADLWQNPQSTFIFAGSHFPPRSSR